MPDAPQPVFRDAAFVISFGRTSSGKTVDALAAFPRAVVCTLNRELKSAISVLDIPQLTDSFEVKTLYDVESVVDRLIAARAKKEKGALYHNAVIVDDVTIVGYLTEQALRDGVNVQGRGHLHPKHWDLWTEIRNQLLTVAYRIAEKCRQAGIHFAVNGHLRTARTNARGIALRGGIDLPTDLTESFAAGADICAMIEYESERLWHPSVFNITNNDTSWATKNRFGLPNRLPSNTGEILRSLGFVLPRPVGMEAHEDYVEQFAQYIQQAMGAYPYSKTNLQQILPAPGAKLSTVIKNPAHWRWIVRDAVDRAYIRRERARGVYEEITPGGGQAAPAGPALATGGPVLGGPA